MDIVSKINKWATILFTVTIVSIIYNIYIYFSKDPYYTGTFFIVIYALIYLVGSVCGLLYMKKIPGIRGNMKSIFIGFLMNAIAMTIGLYTFAYYTIIKGVESPYPSLAEIAFLFTSIGSFIVLVSIFRLYKIQITKRLVIEFFGYFILSSLTIFWILGDGIGYLFTGFPYIDEGQSLLVNLFDFYYAFVDAFTAAVGLTILRVAGGKIFRGLFYFSIGTLFIVVADLIFSYRLSEEIIWNGDINDTFFMISGFFFSLGIILTLKDFVNKNLEIKI